MEHADVVVAMLNWSVGFICFAAGVLTGLTIATVFEYFRQRGKKDGT